MFKNVYSRGVGGQNGAKFGLRSFCTTPMHEPKEIIHEKNVWKKGKGLSKNYVDQIKDYFYHLPPLE